jgi:hypothetical protein
MNWIAAHHLPIGLLADSLTFLGGLILTRDAFLRLRDLKRTRTNSQFLKEFPDLKLTDNEWKAAVVSLRWVLAGFLLLLLGFLAQLLLRFGEV